MALYGVQLSEILRALTLPVLFLLSCMYAMGVFSPRNKFDVAGKTILLTGASDGMGKEVAKILASKGASIIIVARNEQKLAAALLEIQSSASKVSQKFTSLSADVSKPHEAARIFQETVAWNDGQSPDIVWCLAGSAKPQLFLDSTPEIMRQQMDLNYWSCVDMAHVVLGSWLDKKTLEQEQERHLVFTSSVVAFYTIAGYAPYSPGKAAIRSLADTLSQEIKLYSDKIKIHTVFPGTIDSAGYVEEEKIKPEITKILEKDDPIQSAEAVARKSVKGLEAGEELVVVNWLGVIMRACVWGGTPRHSWLIDTITTWIASIAWIFIAMDLNGKVVKFGKKNGHPSTYTKQ